MKDKEILDRLRNDEDYYGEFGKQFLSNSNVGTLLTNPMMLGNDIKISPALVAGRYFHVSVLEPDKLKGFKITESSSRNTKIYKEEADGELILLRKEVDNLDKAIDVLLNNDACYTLIRGSFDDKKTVEYEVPAIKEIKTEMWKGKADIVNHEEKLIVDIKTTSSLLNFRQSAFKYNYDSQAYIYKELFGYDMVFVVVDKITHQIGIFECSEEFYKSGEAKVIDAVGIYKEFHKNPEFNPAQHFTTEVL